MTPGTLGNILKPMKRAADRGGVEIWIALAVLGVLLWGGYRVGLLYFDRSSIEAELAPLADGALIAHDADIQDKIAQVLQNHGADFDRNKIGINVNPRGDRITVRAEYSRVVDWILLKVPLHFDVQVERRSQPGGIIGEMRDSVEDSYNAGARKYERAIKSAQTPHAGE